jgi:2-oxoisovalerate dehydrogenase E1 component
MTFRMRGHEEASGTKYVPPHLFEEWAKKDPVKNYEAFLLNEKILSPEKIESIKETIHREIDAGIAVGFAAPPVRVATAEEIKDVFEPYTAENTDTSAMPHKEEKLIQAISGGMRQAMERFENLVLMGQDIAEYGGAFKVTQGFLETFGKERVRNTPLCESAIVGIALGLSLKGFKAMMEMQFADFSTVGFNQIINNLAKVHYRWGQNADVVIRMPTGGGVGAGPFHSQSNEAWFVHTAGLKVVYPSTPEDAKGLLLAAFEDPNPVMFFEHKALYRSISGPVPEGYYTIEIGKARQVSEGEDLSIITYGAGVHWAMDYAKAHPELGLDILDLRSLAPLDYEAIRASVKRTGKALLLHEDSMIGGIGGEIAAWIAENCFEYLDAPVMRCASLDTPIPFALELEQNFMARSRMEGKIEQLMAY